MLVVVVVVVLDVVVSFWLDTRAHKHTASVLQNRHLNRWLNGCVRHVLAIEAIAW